MLRMRIVTDVTVPFLAVVSVNGTSYYLKHCNGGSKVRDSTNYVFYIGTCNGHGKRPEYPDISGRQPV